MNDGLDRFAVYSLMFVGFIGIERHFIILLKRTIITLLGTSFNFDNSMKLNNVFGLYISPDRSISFLLILLLCLISACQSTRQATFYDFPKPVDTTDKPIEVQEKKTYSFHKAAVFVSNEFDGARLNNCELIDESTIMATISPENTPINASAYYSFQIWSTKEKNVKVILNYTAHKHRYKPKVSFDRSYWSEIDTTQWRILEDGKKCEIDLRIGPDKMYFSAQELICSEDVRGWCEKMAMHPQANFSSIGKSKLGRDLFFLEIGNAIKKKKDAIIILSRQHPPEVTGYLAMQTFIEEVMADTPLSKRFRDKYRMLVFPLMNPDGVDMGHWRHSAGGIDMNRDWAYYHQPETKAIANYIVNTTRQNKNEVILGLDFHSTWHDVYYTMPDNLVSAIPGFKNYWIAGVGQAIHDGYVPNDKPGGLGGPVSKGWFYTQFGAEGITYEIGDETPRNFIELKGRASAREMMQLLVFKGE